MRFECHVEDWHHSLVPYETWDEYADRVVAPTLDLLELLREAQVQGTFYILGYVAAKHPDLVLAIYKAGHQLGSHGYYHRQGEQVGDASDRLARVAIQHAAGWGRAHQATMGNLVQEYRSPYWSTTPMPGYSGGAFFRLMPYPWLLRQLKRSHVFWIHPWELDPECPRIKVPWRYQRHYWGLRGARKKLIRLLREVPFNGPW